jgi:DNA-directed RNA polymerase subunit RPC12/RpoP
VTVFNLGYHANRDAMVGSRCLSNGMESSPMHPLYYLQPEELEIPGTAAIRCPLCGGRAFSIPQPPGPPRLHWNFGGSCYVQEPRPRSRIVCFDCERDFIV